MSKIGILTTLLAATLMSISSLAQDSVESDQESVGEEDAFLVDTSTPSVTLFPVDATTTWGVFKQNNGFDVFRCNGDTGECAIMFWPSPEEFVEGTPGSDSESPESRSETTE